MSAAPFHACGRDRSRSSGDVSAEWRWRAGWETELARLRREMPWFGFFFDGRRWWGADGHLVVMQTSDPDLLRAQLPDAVRRACNAATDRRGDP